MTRSLRMQAAVLALAAIPPVVLAAPVALGAPQAASRAAAAGDRPAALAFVGVNVVPMDRERVLEDQTVIVVGERIQRIGPAARVRVPDGALRVDARGKFVMPGLAEMHAHIPPEAIPAVQAENLFLLFLANGITTIRGMLGHPSHLALRERVLAGELLGPRIYTSGPSFNGNSIPSADSARAAVRHQKAAGYDFLKLHPGLTPETFGAIADEARRVGIPFAGHVSNAVGLERALAARQATIDHLDGYVPALVRDDAPVRASESQFFGFNLVEHVEESKVEALAAATKAAGVWNVPTQSLFVDWVARGAVESLAARSENRYVPKATVANWVRSVQTLTGNDTYTEERARRFLELRRKILSALHRAGAPLLLGSDAPQVFNVPGFSIHEELQALVDAGLSPYDALVTGTRNVATFFGAAKEFGTVEEGKAADLILLDANPLEDVAHVRLRVGVVVRGRWLPEDELRRRLEALAASYME